MDAASGKAVGRDDGGRRRYCPVCGEDSAEELCPNDGTATVLAAGFEKEATSYRANDVIAGRYRITGVLGKGGFGAVYSARHTGTDQAVALKVMMARGDGKKRDAHVKRFFREARLTARLNHPNVVRVFDVGQAEAGPLFLAMELLDGPTLEDHFDLLESQERYLEEPEAIDIGVQLLQGLQHAHEQGLIHRDIKPANVVLTSGHDGNIVCKVLDFGIATAGAERITTTGYALGTPAFMSPEQIQGKELDGRSDVYSVALLLYMGVTGRLPFDSTDAMSLMYAHCNVAPDDPRDHPGGKELSEHFAAILMKALAKGPDDRFTDADEMRRALKEVRTDRWPVAPPFMLPEGGGALAVTRRNISSEMVRGPTLLASSTGVSAQKSQVVADTRKAKVASSRAFAAPTPEVPTETVTTPEPSALSKSSDRRLALIIAAALLLAGIAAFVLRPGGNVDSIDTSKGPIAILAEAEKKAQLQEDTAPAPPPPPSPPAVPAPVPSQPDAVAAPTAAAAAPTAPTATAQPATIDPQAAAKMIAEIQARAMDKLSREAKRPRERLEYARQAAALAPHVTAYKDRLATLEEEVAKLREDRKKRRRARRPAPEPSGSPPARRKVKPKFAD